MSRLNNTYVSLMCRVNANVPVVTEWSVININVDNGAPQRISLYDGDLVDGQEISVTVDYSDSGMDHTETTVLVAPDIILEGDVRCAAFTAFGSQRSMEGAFQGQKKLTMSF